MIITQALRHGEDISVKLTNVDLSKARGGGDEIEPTRENIRVFHSEGSLSVCKQFLVERDRPIASPCQLVQLGDVPPRLQRLRMIRAQDSTAISEESLRHQERFFGSTTPTDASQQVAPSDEGLRIIGSQPIAPDLGHTAKDRFRFGVEPCLRQRSPQQTAQIQSALTVGTIEPRVGVNQ
jgi:hypothetical protein